MKTNTLVCLAAALLLAACCAPQKEPAKVYVWQSIGTKTNMDTLRMDFRQWNKGLSLALFLYFEFHGGFLFVDWMWNGKERNGKLLKEKLENELKESSQLLFLRTTASELNLRGNHIIRQWCSWEIGNFYSKKKEQKYLLAFYNQNNRNILLDSFHVFHDVSNGVII